ncbi:hypothetical protein O988_05838 [Pseudogymnoascus sp. VKM F-3808]|nr:hypothetical protein O988_05838 [Pseudogymnoascus sp. VKM F-3808]
MSTPIDSTTNRSYPLSPTPNSEVKRSQPVSFQPRTPQSPLQPNSASSEKVPNNKVSGNMSSTISRTVQGPAMADAHDGATPVTIDSNIQADDLSNKRKREAEDTGDREQKKVHVEERKLCIEDLHLDVGKIYQLCRTPHPYKQPDLSLDLFELYGLNPTAAKVARVLPNGEKNGLRKTYKGKIKDLGISGKFDVTVNDEESSGGLLSMMREPEHEWMVTQRLGKEIEKGLPQGVFAALPAAMTMAKGVIPKQMWDSSVLGELDIPEKKPAAQVPTKPTSVGMQKSGSQQSGAMRGSKADLARPKRAVKKRGYDESSFEGYGEGYVDDDMVDAGYSTGEGDDRGGPGKRRKKSALNQPQYGPSRHGSYGPGMVGA